MARSLAFPRAVKAFIIVIVRCSGTERRNNWQRVYFAFKGYVYRNSTPRVAGRKKRDQLDVLDRKRSGSAEKLKIERFPRV